MQIPELELCWLILPALALYSCLHRRKKMVQLKKAICQIQATPQEPLAQEPQLRLTRIQIANTLAIAQLHIEVETFRICTQALVIVALIVGFRMVPDQPHLNYWIMHLRNLILTAISALSWIETRTLNNFRRRARDICP